jgi:hypothetical protein
MSDSGGLSERAEARRFPLPLTGVRERKRLETVLPWTCETSGGRRELVRLSELYSPENTGLSSGRILLSRTEGGYEWECDDRRLGDCERDRDASPGSQRRVRS